MEKIRKKTNGRRGITNSRSELKIERNILYMKIYNNTKIIKRFMNHLEDEFIYDLGIEIRNGIEKATGESIPDWSYAFQIISDISEGYLFDTLDREKYFNLIGHINNDLTYYQIEEIVNQAAKHLEYVS